MLYSTIKRVPKFYVEMRRIYCNKRIKIFGCLVLLTLIVYRNTIPHVKYLKISDNKNDFQLFHNMDVVYTWVNGSDEKFIEAINKFTHKVDSARYDDRNELKYSIRSLEKFAPWVRHVYIVTNGQIPSWLNLEYEKVSIVPHDQIAQDPAMLPTFSSNIIEQFIHRIPNLSKRFMYLNDDIFIGSELYPEDLYTSSGGFQIVTTRKIPDCALYCPWSQLKDGICDKECNIPECEFDGNDCIDGNEVRENKLSRISDVFIISLTHTSRVFNLAYGLNRRGYLPHVGFLFDKDIIEEMLEKFQKEFNSTRYNRLRTKNDMQVGYSYYHYIMSERLSVSADEIFDRYDLDKSGTWSEDEIQLVLEDLDVEPLNRSNEEYFKKLISNCFKNSSDSMDAEFVEGAFFNNSTDLNVNRNLVTKCSPLNDIIVKGFSKESRYQFQYTNHYELVSRFILLPVNITEVTNYLTIIRRAPRKFNCIGDYANVKYDTEEKRILVKNAIDDFYNSLFPHRSKFELPESVQNSFRYYDDYFEWKTSQKFKSIFCGILGALVIFFIVIIFCHKLKIYSKSL